MNRHICFLWSRQREREISKENIGESIAGWIAYAMHGDSYKLRNKMLDDFRAKSAFKP